MAELWWLWPIVTAGFLLFYIRERMTKRTIRKDLVYINRKMHKFTDDEKPLTQEKLLVVTGEPGLQELLRSINSLLDRARQSATDYTLAEQSMRRMLSNVSHDLKTPLTVIMGYAEILDQNDHLTPDDRRRMISQLYKKTTQVQKMIHDFFDLTKLEADDYDIALSVVDACEVCRQRILVYFDLLSGQNIEVDIDIPEEPVWVYANEEVLSRTLDNLLSNAVRYGADGRYLGLSLARVHQEIQIHVIDRGHGIAQADQARVFERLYTMDDSRNQGIRGNGLGLTIAKRLTERLGGRISLTSIPHHHTCFTLTFPVSESKSVQSNKTEKLRTQLSQ